MAGVQQGGGGKTPSAQADINITPLVDVMLVLLIVFMISAPMLEQGLDVNLPQAAAETLEPPKEKTIITVAVDKEQRIVVNQSGDKDGGKLVAPTELKNIMKAYAANPNTVVVNVEADAALQYGFLAKVISTIRKAGVKEVNLVTQPNEDQSSM
ncbi:MAG: ExbD/TolR family protein [Deltaproteobacteria bacterium]|jgi:biopolymer transport protein TolR|nr:ExbD/TolR family protein [Deltaproteobacteria bacterium]